LKRLQTRLTGIPKERLDLFLMQWLPRALDRAVTRSVIRKLIVTGGVYVNRHRCEVPSTNLYSGAVIEVFFDEVRLQNTRATHHEPSVFRKEWILFEDEWLIAVNKPVRLPTQPTLDPARSNLYRLLGDHLRERDPNAYLGLHHRLDRDTSGVVLFTKREEANKGVSTLFLEHSIQKTYQSLVWTGNGSAHLVREGELRIDNFLAKKKAEKGKTRYGSVSQGGDRAITDLRVIERFPTALWLEARPQTGRTHQIRVHCSEAGFPIFGDELYFPREVVPLRRPERLMLHALRLQFEHPVTRLAVSIEAPLPDDFTGYLAQISRENSKQST
jgi:RluA family pseudouridine synthase